MGLYHKGMKLPHPFAKPFPIPVQSLVLLTLVGGLTWMMLNSSLSVYWTIPAWLFVPCFFWAERQEYQRQNRLHRSWANSVRLWEERMANRPELRAAQRRAHMQGPRHSAINPPPQTARRRARPYETNWEDTLTV